jgi:hypothetical protein
MDAMTRGARHLPVMALGVLLCLISATPGCAGSIQGQVLDAQTGQPVGGAIVLGVWSRIAGLPGLHHTEYVGVREAETDAEGRFVLERPSSRYNREDGESVTVYMPGYIAWNNLFLFPDSRRREDKRVPPKIALEKFPAHQSHKQHVRYIDGATEGRYNPETTPKFWKAVRPEHFMP